MNFGKFWGQIVQNATTGR